MLTRDQIEARRSGIGGSDVASILGISPWKSSYDVYLAKTTNEYDDELDGKDHIIFGNLMEPVIRAEFARRNNKVVIDTNELFKHPDHPWMLANVDGIIQGENAGLEIKTASEFSDGWGDEGTDQVPQYYLTQGIHYMAVMGWDRIYFAVLIGGNKYRQYCVERDEDTINSIIAVEKSFWEDHVLAGVPPPRPVKVLRDVWSSTTGDKKEATEEIVQILDELKNVKKTIDDLTIVRDKKESLVKEYIGDSDELIWGGKKVASWKFNKSSQRFSADKLKKEDPATYEKYVTEVAGPRVFRVT